MVSTARTVSESAAAGQQLRDRFERGGQLVERVRHAAEEQQHEEQRVRRGEVRLGAQRPGHEQCRCRRTRPCRARARPSAGSPRAAEFAEIYFERRGSRSIVGNIYKGKVDNVLPGLEAAFVDIGLDKNGFLHVDEIVLPGVEKVKRGRGQSGGRASPTC